MRTTAAKDHSEDFYVIGIGLPAPSRERLAAAFPHCILFNAPLDLQEQVKNLCDLLGKVVIFSYMPAMHGRKWLRTSAVFHQEIVKVIGVHPLCTDALYDQALDAELSGVIEADSDPAIYRRAAISVQRAELWFPRGYLSRRTRVSLSSTSPGSLSEREADILALLASGITNQDIANQLFISRDTVRWHLRSIYTKLGVSDREAAYRLAKNTLASPTRERQNH